MTADAIRSLLFVPGARPDRFAKAAAAGASCVCIDLEDAVPEDGKAAARAAVVTWLGGGGVGAVRVNQLVNAHGLADLLALAPAPPAFVLVPKVENAGQLSVAHGTLPGAGLIPLIESPEGLANADAIARAPGVVALTFGGVDFSAELGVAVGWEALLLARSMLAYAAARAGVGLIDVPYLALDDATGCEAETARVRALGFTGKAAIHPSQIAPIHRAFRPDEAAVAEARAATQAFAASDGGAARHDGKLLEAPLMRHYARVLAVAETAHA